MSNFYNNVVYFPITITRNEVGKKMPNFHGVKHGELTESIALGNYSNFAIRTGRPRQGDIGFTVIDLDLGKPGDSKMCGIAWWRENVGDPEAFEGGVVKTMSGGYHLYCAYDPELQTSAGLFGAGVDIRNDSNGLIFGGEGYTHVKEMPNIEDLPPAPAAFMERYQQIKTVVLAAPQGEDLDLETAGERLYDWVCTEFGQIAACRKLPGMLVCALRGTFCNIARHKHSSNHQFVVLTRTKVLYKCHSAGCDNALEYEYTTEQFIEVNKMLEKTAEEMWETCDASDAELSKSLIFMLKEMVDNFDVVTVGKIFWYFNGTRWQSSEQSQALFEDAFDLLVAKFMMGIEKNTRNLKSLQAKKEKGDLTPKKAIEVEYSIATCKANIKALKESMTKCKSRSNKDRVMGEVAARKTDNRFLERLDMNPWLLGFDDCILDLQTKETRPGRPEDFVSKSVGYNYPHPSGRMQEIEVLFSQLFPDEEIREYVTKVLAQSLGGHISSEQSIHFHKGSGSNGKSMLNKLMETALGEYYATIPAQRFSSNKDKAGVADPELVRLRGCRYVGVQEPAKSQPLKTSYLKNWSSDPFTARDCYSNVVVTITPTFRMHFFCNFIPELDNVCGGITRRFRVVNYIAIFTGDESIVDPEQHIYLADSHIITRLKDELRGDLFQYFLDRFDANWKEQAPAAIKDLAQDFLADSDPSDQFLKGYLKRGELGKDYLLSKDVYKEYLSFCREMKITEVIKKANFHTRLATWAQAEKHGSFVNKTNVKDANGKFVSALNVLRGWAFKERYGADDE